jgi:hypothetical protein
MMPAAKVRSEPEEEGERVVKLAAKARSQRVFGVDGEIRAVDGKATRTSVAERPEATNRVFPRRASTWR